MALHARVTWTRTRGRGASSRAGAPPVGDPGATKPGCHSYLPVPLCQVPMLLRCYLPDGVITVLRTAA
jgi:hypothetical protein